MTDIIDKFKSLVPVIAIILYTYGYSYLSIYYGFFDISIEYYVSLTDILFKTINILIFLSIFFLIQEIFLILWSTAVLKVYYFRKLNGKIKNRIKSEKVYDRYYVQVIEKYIERNLETVSLFSFLIFGSTLIFLTKEYLNGMTVFFPFLIVKLYKFTPKENSETKNRIIKFSSLALFVILLISFGLWGYNDATEVKENGLSHKIEFKSNNVSYKTGYDNLNFIGETSSYIFVYDKKERKTLVFSKINLTDFKVFNISLTEKEEEKLSKEIIQSLDDLFNLN